MSSGVNYTLYHPRWYRRRVSVWWWLEKRVYTKFVVRELTSLAVAFFAGILLWKVRALQAGPEAYSRFLDEMKSPPFVLLNSVAFLFILFHTMTWFNLAPKAMVVRWGGKRLPDWAIQGMNYFAWIVISAILCWLALRG